MPSAQLAAAAFGADTALWPLPPATTCQQRWLRAVAAAGQGHYGCAEAELAILRRTARGPLLSLAHSTQGSLLRQLGGHRSARGWDGRALLAAGQDTEARADALVGLAADALGLGRFALSATLLDRADRVVGADSGAPDRLAVRLAWVSAELAMATGDGDAAVRQARLAVDRAASGHSVRHRVKSSVVLAAALCCAGQVPAARILADQALAETERCGMIPLRWALASLLAGIGSDAYPPSQVDVIRDTAAEVIARRGGHWHRA